MTQTSRTKTFTLGEPYIRELIHNLDSQISVLKKDNEWPFNNSKQISNLESFVSLLKQIPWNEGGYSIEDFA